MRPGADALGGGLVDFMDGMDPGRRAEAILGAERNNLMRLEHIHHQMVEDVHEVVEANTWAYVIAATARERRAMMAIVEAWREGFL